MIDIFIPACNRDVEQLLMLCRSLNAFVESQSIHSIVICSVGQDNTLSEHPIKDTAKSLISKFHFMHQSDLGLPNAGNGWLLQQAAKLAFSKVCSTDFYLVLDCKNILLKSVNLNSLFVSGKAPMPTCSVRNHPKWWKGSAWALTHNGILNGSADKPVINSVPPVFINTKECYGLISYIEGKFRKGIGQFMVSPRPIRHRFMRPSEFTLYHTWLDKQGTINRLHYPSNILQSIYLWGRHSTDDLYSLHSRIISNSDDRLFAGIHWRAWNRLSSDQKNQISNLITSS
jgi:hypothetical protein